MKVYYTVREQKEEKKRSIEYKKSLKYFKRVEKSKERKGEKSLKYFKRVERSKERQKNGENLWKV